MWRAVALGFLCAGPALAAGDAPAGGAAEPAGRPVVAVAEVMCPVDLAAPDLTCAPGSRAAYWRGIGIGEAELMARVLPGHRISTVSTPAPVPAPVPLTGSFGFLIAAIAALTLRGLT